MMHGYGYGYGMGNGHPGYWGHGGYNEHGMGYHGHWGQSYFPIGIFFSLHGWGHHQGYRHNW